MRSSSVSGIVAVLLAALVIGCGGAGENPTNSGFLSTTGSLPSTGSGGGTTGTTGTTGGSPIVFIGDSNVELVTKIDAIDLRFSQGTKTNAKSLRINEVSSVSAFSGVGYTPKGAYLYLEQNNAFGWTRALSLDIPLDFVEGATYTYAPSTDDAPIVADYQEFGDYDENGSELWHAEPGGTVTVVATSEDTVTLRFEGLRFVNGTEEGNTAQGSFTVSGTIRLRYVEASGGDVVGTAALDHRQSPR